MLAKYFTADPLLLPSASASGRESLSQTGLSSRDITGSSVLDPSSQTQLSVREVIGSTDPAVQHGVKVVCWLQVFQQVSGINAALYGSFTIRNEADPTQVLLDRDSERDPAGLRQVHRPLRDDD